MTSTISPKLLKLEDGLMETKWWDYRHLSPLDATYIYADAYKVAKRLAITRRTDLYRGINNKGLTSEDFMECSKATVTGLWKGRQMADRLGIPYDFYCHRAFKYCEKRLWERLPQPCHLYSEKAAYEEDRSIVEEIGIGWLDYKQDQILFARDDFYKSVNYKAHPAQKAHMLYLIGEVKRRPQKAIALCTLVYEQEVLAESVARAALGHDLLTEAKKFIATVKSPLT